MPPITLYSLPQTRSLRIAWLLEELQLAYEVVSAERLPNSEGPPEFRAKAGALGKSPTIHDGELVLQESGAIVDYLCTTYPSPDSTRPLLPTSPPVLRAKIIEYLHLAEGTFMQHATPMFHARRILPADSESLAAIEARVIAQVTEDLEWLEAELQIQKANKAEGTREGLFLVGGHFTGADIMMGFSAALLLQRVVAVLKPGMRYPAIEEWVVGLKGRKAYRAATEKLGFGG